MASFNGNIPTPTNGFNAKVEYSYSQSISDNMSTITSIVGLVKRNNSTYYPYNTTKSATIKIEYLNNNGSWVTATTLSNSSSYNLNTNNYVTFVSGSNINIPHKSDGTQQIKITFSVDGKLQNYYPKGTISKIITLTTIPRYANITSFSCISTINSITMSYSVEDEIDSVQYRLNMGDWNIYPSYGTIYNLSPNTSYSIQIRVKKTDSQLWTGSNVLLINTYDYAKITSAPNVTIGNNAVINYNNPYTANIEAGIFSTNQDVIAAYRTIDRLATSYTFNFTQSEINKMYEYSNKNSVIFRYYIKTICNGISYYDYVERTFSVNVSSNNPIFSNFEYEDVNSITYNLTGDSSKIIKKYSDLKVTIPLSDKMIAQNGATPYNYNIIVGNSSIPVDYSSNSSVSATFTKVNSNDVIVYAIDSRGNQTIKSKSLNIIPYEESTIQELKIERENGIGENLEISLKAKYSTTNFGNTLNNINGIYINYREKGTSTWVTWIDITNRFSISNGIILGENIIISNLTLTLGKEYEILIDIQDKLCDTQEIVEVSDGKVLFSAVKGKGVNFGGLYDIDEGGALQVNGKKVGPHIQNYISKSLNTPGWYRVAKLDNGAYGYSSIIQVSTTLDYANNCSFLFAVNFDYQSGRIIQLNGVANLFLINQVRITRINNDMYFEIYYNSSTQNVVDVEIFSQNSSGTAIQIVDFVPATSSETIIERIVTRQGIAANCQLTSSGTFNRGSWGVPKIGIITQIGDNTAEQHSVIVGQKSNGDRNYGIDFYDSDTNPIMRLYSGSTYLEISPGVINTNGALKSTTDSGNIQIGSRNTAHCHYDTDRPDHWFNTDVKVAGNIYRRKFL